MLFSDIEGSTRLLRDLGELYPEALSLQRRIVRESITKRSGYELGTEGDSFFVVFASPSDALAAAIDAQRELHMAQWPAGKQVRVRMGLHAGELTPHEDNYTGFELHRAARIAATANGAQVVVSAALRTTVEHDPSLRVGFRDLGHHRLKDMPEPEHLYQVLVDGLPDITTAIKSLGAPTNLPPPRAPLIGREADIANVVALVTQGTRLVTITGPGGVGKTSLAVAVAKSLEHEFASGIYFTPLELATDVDQAWEQLGAVLGAADADDRADAVIGTIGDARLLLVLDNLEQVRGAAGFVASLLNRTTCAILTTARGPSHVRDEHEYGLAPLAASSAIELFVREVRRVRRSFERTVEAEQTIASICARVDGLPLALELVASRLRVLNLDAVAASLSAQLAAPSRDADRPERQRTLAATIAWSHDLLSTDEQRAFARLGVFAGGCDLEGAAAVLERSGSDAVAQLDHLADVSLVSFVDAPEGGTRISMLRAVQEFASERLDKSDQASTVRRRHAQYCVELAEAAEAQLRGPRQLLVADRLMLEQENLQAAFDWSTSPAGDPRLALRLASALGWFWYTHGRSTEGRAWLERAVAHADTADDATDAGAKALHALGVLQQQQGDNEEALISFERALERWSANDDAVGIARELNSMGIARWAMDQPAAARALLTESAAVARAAGDAGRLASALSNLGLVDLSAGAVSDAVAAFEEALSIDTFHENVWGIAVGKTNLAAALFRAGDVGRGRALLQDVLPTIAGLDDPDLLASAIESSAIAAAIIGRPTHAAMLLGGADAIRADARAPRTPPEDAYLERELGPARHELGSTEFDAIVSRGRALARTEVLEAALDVSRAAD